MPSRQELPGATDKGDTQQDSIHKTTVLDRRVDAPGLVAQAHVEQARAWIAVTPYRSWAGFPASGCE